MSDTSIADILERDLREIPVPPPEQWFPARQHRPRRPVRPLLIAAAAAAAVLIGLLIGAEIARLRGDPQSHVADPSAPVGLLARITISGTVTDAATGAPVSGVTVFVLRDNAPSDTEQLHIIGAQYTVKWSFSAWATTRPDGTYSVGAATGRYRVLFSAARSFIGAPSRSYQPLWWPSATNDEAATVITLGSDRPGLDAALIRGHEISGRTSRNGTVYVYLAGASCCVIVHGAVVDVDETYHVAVPDGTYRLQFVPGMPFPEPRRWWNDAAEFGQARDVTVNGADVTGIDILGY